MIKFNTSKMRHFFEPEEQPIKPGNIYMRREGFYEKNKNLFLVVEKRFGNFSNFSTEAWIAFIFMNDCIVNIDYFSDGFFADKELVGFVKTIPEITLDVEWFL